MTRVENFQEQLQWNLCFGKGESDRPKKETSNTPREVLDSTMMGGNMEFLQRICGDVEAIIDARVVFISFLQSGIPKENTFEYTNKQLI